MRPIVRATSASPPGASSACLRAPPPARSGQVRFRVTVEEVLVDVVVTDRNRPIAGLTAADFNVCSTEASGGRSASCRSRPCRSRSSSSWT